MAVVGAAQEERVDRQHSVVLCDEPALLELAHEEVHARTCGADHFRDDPLRDVRQRASAWGPRVTAGECERRVGQTAFDGQEELISQIGFEARVAGDDVRDEPVCDRRLRMEQPDRTPRPP